MANHLSQEVQHAVNGLGSTLKNSCLFILQDLKTQNLML